MQYCSAHQTVGHQLAATHTVHYCHYSTTERLHQPSVTFKVPGRGTKDGLTCYAEQRVAAAVMCFVHGKDMS